MCINRAKFLLFSIVGILFLGGFKSDQKAGTLITLHNEKLSFTPHEFFIADVVDERAEKNTVALLIYKDEAGSYITRPSDLKDGAALAIKQFIGHNLNQNSSLRQVVISIKSLKLEETSSPGGRINGHLNIDFSFGLQKDYGVLQLVDYKGGTRYTRPDSQTDMAEPILRQGIEEALIWFNKWINTYADSDPRLAKSVKVRLSDYSEKPEGDAPGRAAASPLSSRSRAQRDTDAALPRSALR